MEIGSRTSCGSSWMRWATKGRGSEPRRELKTASYGDLPAIFSFHSSVQRHNSRPGVEEQVTVSFHGKGQQLPPWDGGRRARRISLAMYPSYSHRRVAEGGALRLHGKDGQGGELVVLWARM